VGSIPTRRIRRKAGPVETERNTRPPTGVAGSDAERRAANRLAEELRSRGRAVSVESVSVRLASGWVISLHALLALGGGLLSISFPLIGATVCLIAAFSYYSESALGSPLLGRLAPTRASQNVISPPPGPAWARVEVLLSAGYDLQRSYPVGEWLSKRFSGRFTTDRILFWGGMVPVFLAAMLNVAAIEGSGTQLLQVVASAILLGVVAAQVDGSLADNPDADEADMQASADAIATLDGLLEEPDADPPVAVCFFGAETRSAAGAAKFFGRRRGPLDGNPVVINFVKGDGGGSKPLSAPPVLLTAKEGDLATLRMSSDLGSDSPVKPKPAILRRTTAALLARRGGLRATTVVGAGEAASEVGLDVIEKVFTGDDDES
jgi:hypothetical protein